MNGWVTLFAEPWIERLGWVLIHFLWQGTGIALLLAAALRVASRASSHVRYVMIGSAFLFCAALPVATWIILGPQASSSIASATVLTPMAVPHVESPVLRGSAPLTNGIMESPGNVQTRWRDNLSRVADVSLPYVVGLWFVGVLILTLRLTMGWMLMRQVCLSGLPIHDAFCLERFRVLLKRMQVGVPVRLLESALVEVPTLIGWLRPTILVPASVLIGLTLDQLEAVLAHELAHVRRYDYLVNLVQTVIETVLFYHPAVWWISRKLREERENCCDDIALEVMQDRLVYASALAQLEAGRGMPLVLTASGGSLLQRIKRIVGANNRKVSAWPLWILIFGILSIACLTKLKANENSGTTATGDSDARVDFEIVGKSIPTSKDTQESILHLLHELLVMRYVNGTPDDIFHWQQLPGSSVEQIKTSGSFLHVVYLKKPSIPVGTTYSYQPDEVWIGLQNGSASESYPGYPAGILVVTSGKDGTFDLIFGSKSLLTGIGLVPEIFPHLPSTMRKSLEANRGAYQHYLDWTSTKDASGQSVNQQVITAVQAGDVSTLQKLITQGVDITKVKGRNPTLLFDAASPEVAELLIQHGVDINALNAWGGTALDSVVRNFSPNIAAITRVLLEHGADPNRPSGELRMTPAMEAYRGDSLDALVEHGADLKATAKDGYGVMFWAGRHDVTYLQSLIRHGIVFDPKKDGPTIMVQAAWVNNQSVMKWLLDHGVDPSAQGLWVHNKNGKDDMMFPLEAVTISGQFDGAKLLLDHGARWNRATARALQNHYSNIVKLLWEHGVREISELTYAISQNAKLDDLEKILQSGAPVNSPDDTIITPLGEAAEMDNLPAVQLLVQHGADVNKGGNPVAEHPEYRDTPLVLAAQRGQDEIVAFLLQHGAQANPNAVSGAANAGIPGSFYVGKDRLPSKEHYEQVIQMLIAAGALKDINPDWTGRILAQAMGPCWGDPDPGVLQKLLAAGLNPEVPMPYIEERGEKPNSVIGYYRDYYRKKKDDPAYSQSASTIKPLLDMLEAADADKGATPKTTSTPSAVANPALAKALVAAAKNGDVPEVDRLLKQGADPNANQSPEGKNALFVAAENNQVDVLKLLLQNRGDPNCANSCDNAPIDWTLSRGHLEAATVLHDAGAKISPEGWAAATGDLITLKALTNSGVLKKGKTDGAMHYATSMGQLEAVKFLESIEGKPVAGKFLAQAARSGNIPMLDYILSRGANIKTDGGDAMDQAIIFFNQPESVKWLLAHGVDPNHFSKWNEFSLAECRSAEMVKILLDAGANPNGQGDGNDDTGAPLVHAPDAESVRLLVQHGANLKPKFKDGYTLIDIVTSRNSEDRSEAVAELINQGAEFDPKGNGATALARAAAWNHIDTMEVLLDHGVSPNAYSADPFMQCSALNAAAWEPSPDAVKLLLKKGANPSGDPRDNNTPLSMAVIFGQTESAELLRKAGAHDVGDLSIAAAVGDTNKVNDLLNKGTNVNEVDNAGNTPLYYAVRRGHVEIATFLIAHGANVNQFDTWGMTPEGCFKLEQAMMNPTRSQMDWGIPQEEGNRRMTAFKDLFAKHPADPDYRDSKGRTALHQAALGGFTELPMGDKAHPVNPNLLDNDGNTPLLLAALSPHASDLETRISVCEDSKAPRKITKDWNGAAYIADCLIKAGAKLDLKMPNGPTQGELAMAAAVKAKNPQLIAVLRDAGVADNSAPPKTTETAGTTGNPATTSDSAAVQPEVIRLTILDAQTNKPVPAVKLHVRINDLRKDLITDASGASDIKLPNEEITSVTIWAKHDGYVPQILGWQKHLHSIRFSNHYEAHLTLGSPISGKIIDQDGHPIAGSEVTALLQGPQIEADLFFNRYDLFTVTTKTDASGKWQFDAFPASLDGLLIRASHPDYQATTDAGVDNYTTTSGLPLTSLRDGTSVIVLKRGQQLSGGVFGVDGQPLAGANLVLGTDLWGANLPETKTDATGHFLFKGISNGDHPLTVQAAGHKPQVIKVSIPSPSLAIHLAKGRILKGYVVDAFGKPYAGLRISIDSWKPLTPLVVEPYNKLRTLRLALRTDATGRFVWDGAPDEPVTYYFADDAQQKYLCDLPLQANDEEQKLVMKPAMHLSAKVVDKKSGQLISHLRMTPGRILPGNGGISWETRFAQAYDKGAVDWQVDLLGNSYVFKIEADGYQPFISDPFLCDMTNFQTTFQLVADSK